MKNDFFFSEIKYSPRLSSVAIKYIALFFMTLSQIALFVQLKIEFSAGFGQYEGVLDALDFVKDLGRISMPLLLIAMTSSIVGKRDREIPKAVIQNAAFTLIFYGAELLVIAFYIIPTVNDLIENYTGIITDSSSIVTEYLGEFASINIFIDLFLCSSIYFFLCYEPRFKGKKLIAFRCLASVPIIYILVCFVINGLAKSKIIFLNVYVGALLPHKKIVVYFFFGCILIYNRLRSRIYEKRNRLSERTYEQYRESNRGALNYSLVLSILLGLLSLIDFAFSFIPGITDWGIGKSTFMFLGIPFLLLFDNRRKPKFSKAGKLVPLYYLVNYLILFLLYAYCLI